MGTSSEGKMSIHTVKNKLLFEVVYKTKIIGVHFTRKYYFSLSISNVNVYFSVLRAA